MPMTRPGNGAGHRARSRAQATSACPRAMDRVQDQAPGHGEIQGVGRADHRDADEVPAELALGRRDAPALLAEHAYRGAGIVEAMELDRPVGRGAHGTAAVAAEPVPEAPVVRAD